MILGERLGRALTTPPKKKSMRVSAFRFDITLSPLSPLTIHGARRSPQMGMWSRPSKRVPEVGQVGLFSPTSPRQFFNSNTSTISIDIEPAAASTVGSTLKLGPDGGDPEMSKEGRDGSGGGGGGDIAAGEPCLSPVGAVTPARSVGVSSATAAGGTPTMVAPSPGNFSAVSAGESVEALLLVRCRWWALSAHAAVMSMVHPMHKYQPLSGWLFLVSPTGRSRTVVVGLVLRSVLYRCYRWR